MQDSQCDSDIDCSHRKLKISYELRESFSQIFIFSNFGMFFEHFKLQIRDIIFLFRKFEKSQRIKIKKYLFINANALRASPAVTRLTVHRRLYTGVYAFWAHMPSSKSITWQSNGSDFSKFDHYCCVTWLFLKLSHEFEGSSLILSLWEAVVSDFDCWQLLKKSKMILKIFFWNLEEL